MTTDKVVLVDWGVFMFRAIFAWRRNKNVPATYTALSMLIGCLKMLRLTPDDLIIIAIDSPKGSWRKQVDANYKANRKKAREQYEDIDWLMMFAEFNKLMYDLHYTSPFHTITLDYLEADDIIAYGTKYYKDRECIILSSDTDYEQLTAYPNVKVFSNISKKFKTVKNPMKTLEKKIEKERTDNLLTPILNQQDYEKRYQIVNLFSLPPDIELTINRTLSNIKDKNYDLSKFPFTPLRNRFMDIYNQPEKKQRKTKKEKANEDSSVQ